MDEQLLGCVSTIEMCKELMEHNFVEKRLWLDQMPNLEPDNYVCVCMDFNIS